MKKENDNDAQEANVNANDAQGANVNENANDAQEANENEDTVDPTVALKEKIAELEDKNLRMMAEFDNYRRRTNKEKLELMETAGERIFKDMLPLVDDFERAAAHGDLSEGGQLIYKKFCEFLEQNKVSVIPTDGAFDVDIHEAITTFAAGEDKKGQVIDCTQKGYKLGEKVIRFAKVVVGE